MGREGLETEGLGVGNQAEELVDTVGCILAGTGHQELAGRD